MTGLGRRSIGCVTLADKSIHINILSSVLVPPGGVADTLQSMGTISRYPKLLPGTMNRRQRQISSLKDA